MHNSVLQQWFNSSHLSKDNQSYIEKIYEIFLNDPDSVQEDWFNFFQELSTGKIESSSSIKNNNHILFNQLDEKNLLNKMNENININHDFLYFKILKLINNFRMYGHQYSTLDPLNLWKQFPKNQNLEFEYYQFQSNKLHEKIDMEVFGFHQLIMTVPEIFKLLNKIYCDNIGIEYMHIPDKNIINWIQTEFESKNLKKFIAAEEKKEFLQEIIAAEGIEQYLHSKFPGVKRFSLEGCDVLIPMLKEIIRYSFNHYNTQEIFLGMAHRGRLNVLVNVLGKNPQDLFDAFLNKQKISIGSGDVKYHQGFYTEIMINTNVIKLSLLYNPSHLEIVTPIVIGSVRARLDQLKKLDHIQPNLNNIVLPIVIHGDAALSAQGIVQETFNMSKTRAYDVGGTIHIVINNQVGFTTSNISDMRSTQYCTDIAKMVNMPVFHVNADDVDSVITVIRSALNFRYMFKSDIIIDLVCYRRHGHNESDEPSVTQPKMYQRIHNHPTLFNIYSNFLNKKNIIDINDINKMVQKYKKILENDSCVFKNWVVINNNSRSIKNSTSYKDNENKINIDIQSLENLAHRISSIPSNIVMHSRVEKIYYSRSNMAKGTKMFDWGGAETLAYATLLNQGISIRLSGEDVARGTFFHRHAVIYDQTNETKYIPLMNIQKNQGSFYIWDSVLSEASTLAFEYGYANVSKNMLVIWEAQFGDFVNAAQVVIDQFISSSEQKWGQLCNLVMLLPHGYEGQGPEHSSARIERFLQLCANNNMKICVPSTPSQIYHILRYQAICSVDKKPLIIMSPKSLLRHPMATSSLQDLANGSFYKILYDIKDPVEYDQINRIIMCTGKIYYDLLYEKNNYNQFKISIIRIEQLYPFPIKEIQQLIQPYIHTIDFVWCQEEPKNQGAWHYVKNCFYRFIPKLKLHYVGRPSSAAPAVGFFPIHQKEQKKLINEALNLN